VMQTMLLFHWVGQRSHESLARSTHEHENQ
jgi:hypothetical protein